MSPYKKGGYPGYFLRVSVGRRARVLGLSTQSPQMAKAMTAWVAQLKKDRRFDVLEPILAGEFTIAQAFDHRHALDAWLAQRAAERVQAAEPDLDPLVTQWGGRSRRVTSPKYVTQVRRFIPAGERFGVSRFTPGELASFLGRLDVSDPTRNRYKAALSAFAGWLVTQGYLERNPLRGGAIGLTFSERTPRLVELRVEDAQRLVDALAGDARTAAALMCGTGMEWGAVAAARRADVDLERRTIMARGSKTPWRRRLVAVTEDWCWRILLRHLKTLTPAAPLVTITESRALAEQTAACTALELPRIRLHDWRHVYAITAIRRGDDHQAIKRQLGHSPRSMLLYSTYGVYLNEPGQRIATSSATSGSKRREVKRAKS